MEINEELLKTYDVYLYTSMNPITKTAQGVYYRRLNEFQFSKILMRVKWYKELRGTPTYSNAKQLMTVHEVIREINETKYLEIGTRVQYCDLSQDIIKKA